MNAVGRYDPALQMFVEAEKELDLAHLRFERWLVEHDRSEHEAFSDPKGDYSIIDLMEKARGR